MDSLVLQLELQHDSSSKASILKQLSKQSIISSDYRSAIFYLQREVVTHAASRDSLSWANAHFNLGMIYTITINYEDAKKHSFLALKYFEKHNMLIPLANTCVNIGFIMNEEKHYDKAYAYYQRALKIFSGYLDQQELDATFYNMSIYGKKLTDMEKLEKSQNETRSISDRFINSSLAIVYSSLGILGIQRDNLEEASMYMQKSLEVSVKNNDISAISNSQINLGRIYLRRGLNAEANSIIEEGLKNAKTAGNKNLEMEAYSELAKVSMSLGNATVAYSYYDQYVHLKDSLYKEQLAVQLTLANRRFEVLDNTLDPGVLLKQNLDQSYSLNNSDKFKIALLVALAVIIILLFFFFRRYYFKVKVANELKEKNLVIEDQKTKLEALIQTKDRFLSIIAHDLKNPFNSLLGFADLAYNDFDEISDADKKSYINVIRQSGQHIYALLDNLLNWSRAQSGRIDFYPEPVSLTETIESAVELVRGSADNKQISLFSDFSRDVIVKADKNMLSTILRNLLTNAIKFTPNGGSVTVSSRVNHKKVTVSVTDTGIGMTAEELERLFKLDGGLKTSGTANETGTGLGLILCQEFLNLHKSKIIAESTPGKGSTFSFALDFIQQL